MALAVLMTGYKNLLGLFLLTAAISSSLLLLKTNTEPKYWRAEVYLTTYWSVEKDCPPSTEAELFRLLMLEQHVWAKQKANQLAVDLSYYNNQPHRNTEFVAELQREAWREHFYVDWIPEY